MRMRTYLSDDVCEEDELKVRSYNFKIALNRVIKMAQENGIPCFFSWKVPGPGRDYEYGGVIPEECEIEDESGEYGKFIRFFQVCASLNEDHKKQTIRKTKSDDEEE